MYRVIIKCWQEFTETESGEEKAYGFFNSKHPIAHRSNGTVVAIRDCDLWLDYSNVTHEEIMSLLEYISNVDETDIEIRENICVQVRPQN